MLSFENTEGLQEKNVDDVCLVYQGQTHIISLLQNRRALDHIVLDDTANLALAKVFRSEEHTSELQSPRNLVCRLLLEKKNGSL